jgi:regulator of nonsense transcripts 2
MPDVGSGVIEILDQELRYLQRKKLVKELDSTRLKVSSRRLPAVQS